MTDKDAYDIQLVQLFCEDFRVEDSGKPMLIGILSPVLYGDEDVSFRQMVIMSIINVPHEIELLDLELQVRIPGSDEVEVLTKRVSRDESEQEGDNWIAFLSIRRDVNLTLDGPAIEATLRTKGKVIRSTLQARRYVESPDE